MNVDYEDLFAFLRIRFPDTRDIVFEVLVKAALDGRKKGESLYNMSENTAKELKKDFGNMIQTDLDVWLSGILNNRMNKFQELLEKPMFDRKT